MKYAQISLVVAACLLPASAGADIFDSRPDLRFCVAGMLGGFRNGLEERACAKYFDLPSNYHFACARGVVRGFPSRIDRAACVTFFEGQAAAAKSAYVRPQ
ncbi:hypothetical protein [Microbaculum marinum]|uniref:Uncharacterized protein n=1 Tax=Microbaculum marinum TaxID=1764581 RepID=A0AAW9RDH3_9HYPH